MTVTGPAGCQTRSDQFPRSTSVAAEPPHTAACDCQARGRRLGAPCSSRTVPSWGVLPVAAGTDRGCTARCHRDGHHSP